MVSGVGCGVSVSVVVVPAWSVLVCGGLLVGGCSSSALTFSFEEARPPVRAGTEVLGIRKVRVFRCLSLSYFRFRFRDEKYSN